MRNRSADYYDRDVKLSGRTVHYCACGAVYKERRLVDSSLAESIAISAVTESWKKEHINCGGLSTHSGSWIIPRSIKNPTEMCLYELSDVMDDLDFMYLSNLLEYAKYLQSKGKRNAK